MLARLRVPLSWTELFKRTIKEALADDVFSLAAQQAYYFLFALFPALLAMISIASYFPVEGLVDGVVEMLGGVAPPDVIRIINEQVVEIASSSAGGILTFAFLFTLWSSSGAMMSMISTLNAAYDVIESRPWWKTRMLAILLTMAMAIFVLASMTLIIAGPTMAERLATQVGLGDAFEWTWKIAQWPLVAVLVATGIALVYYYAPDVVQDWVWITPGSVIATCLWILVSLGLKMYLSFAGDYNETYGTIGGVMVLMLWFYLSGVAILMGAELNSEIEHASPYGKGVGERLPGEKKLIGAAAQREYEARTARGELPVRLLPDDVNCDLDEVGSRQRRGAAVKPSELLIGVAALLPAAIEIGRSVKKKVNDGHEDERTRAGSLTAVG
jgi:membrane protein